MWKWIVGVVVLIVVILAGTCYYAVRKLNEKGNSTQVTIGASQEKVFAALADADSLVVWMEPGSVIPTGHGLLKVGDSVILASSRRPNSTRRMIWVVTEVRRPEILAIEIRGDSSDQAGLVRRDSLSTVGDSTVLTSTFTSPVMDSMRAQRGDTNTRGGLIERTFTSIMRMMAEGEIARLKAHMEGKPLGKPSTP